MVGSAKGQVGRGGGAAGCDYPVPAGAVISTVVMFWKWRANWNTEPAWHRLTLTPVIVSRTDFLPDRTSYTAYSNQSARSQASQISGATASPASIVNSYSSSLERPGPPPPEALPG